MGKEQITLGAYSSEDDDKEQSRHGACYHVENNHGEAVAWVSSSIIISNWRRCRRRGWVVGIICDRGIPRPKVCDHKRGDIVGIERKGCIHCSGRVIEQLGVVPCIVIFHTIELRLYETMKRQVSEESGRDFGRSPHVAVEAFLVVKISMTRSNSPNLYPSLIRQAAE